MNKFRIPGYIIILSSLCFSLLSVSFSFDVSLLAFPLAVGFSVLTSYFLCFKILKNKDYSAYKITEKLLQYLSYILLISFILRRAGKNGTVYFYDVITVVLWCVNFVSSQYFLYFFNDKKIYALVPEWKNYTAKKSGGMIVKKDFSLRGLFKEVLDWVDALVQAVFMVLLIQIFILQLYVIPSESMVPSFLIGDRVVVTKTSSGPTFPLSEVGLPCLKKYKRGDVIVFRNPHYSMDRKSEVRSVISQIVYMLTFTTVNLNVDEHGEPKADPLVKRICGVPGEQLVMQDGVLYARTVESDKFEPVKLDSKFACWNLSKYEKNPAVRYIPLSQEYYEAMIEFEAERRALNILNAASECRRIAKTMNLLRTGVCAADRTDDFKAPESMRADLLFSGCLQNASEILKASNSAWFESFMCGWTDSSVARNILSSVSRRAAEDGEYSYLDFFDGDYYSEANFKLNLMTKIALGELYVYTAGQMQKGFSASEIVNSPDFKKYSMKVSECCWYISLLDQRNMPLFPANSIDGQPSYIPENCYFMMGDNRFNSLDMRHSYESVLRNITELDSYSVQYSSDIAPQYVHRKRILGSAVYRFWPLSRSGGIKTN